MLVYAMCHKLFSQGFCSGTLPCPIITFEDAELLATWISTAQWYKSHAHISFQSKVIEYFQLNMNEV